MLDEDLLMMLSIVTPEPSGMKTHYRRSEEIFNDNPTHYLQPIIEILKVVIGGGKSARKTPAIVEPTLLHCRFHFVGQFACIHLEEDLQSFSRVVGHSGCSETV